MRMRKIVLTLTVLSLLAVVGISQTWAGSIPTKDRRQPLLMAQTPEAVKPWKLSVQTTSEAGQKPDFTITIHFPVLETSDNKGSAFSKAVANFITQAVSDFKKGLVEIKGGPNMPSTLDIGYDAYTTNRGLISIRFRIDQYNTGAAHPAHATYTLNYNLSDDKPIILVDLFKPGAKYLDVIANYTVRELKQQNRLLFPEGATPTADNYSHWNFDRGGLLFTFDPYQVGPYAQGPSEVLIPYIALESVLKPNLPIWQY